MGFYDPIAPADGNLGSAYSIQAIKNFQRVFGIPVNGVSNAATRKKLDEVMNFYNSIKTADLAKVARRMSDYIDYDESLEIANTRRTWTFLRLGMGLDQKQAAGVMGNLLRESGLSPTNVQNTKVPGPSKLRDTAYNYSTTDDIGYGLMQWTYSSRKAGLIIMANTMGSSLSDLNVQFAYMKLEMERDNAEPWNRIKASKSIDDVTRIFLKDIERPSDDDLDPRLTNANIVYNALMSY